MLEFDKNDQMESQGSRQKKKALKFLRQAFEARKKQLSEAEPKKKQQLEVLMSSMKVNRLKDAFYKKLTVNNIFQSPTKLQLLSQKEKDKKRWIKLQGFHLHTNILSIVYVLEMLFMIITFYIASCMAFLIDFVESNVHQTKIVFGLNLITMVLCFVKIVITSASQRIKRGILLIYITDIFLDYAKSFTLFLDLVYLFIMVMLFIIRKNASHLIEEWSVVLFIISIIRIAVSSSNLTLFRTTFINSLRKDQYYKLFQVVIFNFIFAHFVASILFAMSRIDSNQNWMIAKNIYHEVWYVQYMWGYYWATTTMMTVGFGDFLPVTYREGFIVAFLEFFSCIVLAYNISEIGGIISTIRSSQNQYIAKIAVFKRMAEQNQIDFELKTRIEGYLRQQKAIKEKFEFNQQNELLQSLPQPLRKEFIMASNGKLFKYLPFFKNLQKKTLLRLAQSLTSKVFYPSEILQKADQYNENIMILKEGKVGLAFRRSDSLLNGIIVQEIQIIKREFITFEGQSQIKNIPILLNVQFLSPGKVVNYDMTAMTYSYVFELSKTDFLETIKMSDIDTQYYFSITHQQISTNEWEQLPCNECTKDIKEGKNPIKRIQSKLNGKIDDSDQTFNHTKFECPKLHYLPFRGVIILKYLTTRGNIQQRKPKYNRNKQRLESCLTLRKIAFKTYQKKRFLNEKKQLDRIIQKSISNKSKISKKQKQKTATFKNKSSRKGSEVIIGIPQKIIENSTELFTLNKNLTQKQSLQFDQYRFEQEGSNEVQSQYEQEQHTIIESMIKYAVQEMNPRHAILHFWDLQIDLIENFFNYFPQDNAAKLDNIQLCRDKQSKVKGLCLISEILKLKKNQENNDKQNKTKNNAMAALMEILFKKTIPNEKSVDEPGITSNDIQYKKVYETQQMDVIKEQNEKYLQRYSKFTYQFPKQRITDTTDQRPSLDSVKRVRFSYGSTNQNAQNLSNSRNQPFTGIQRNEPAHVNFNNPTNNLSTINFNSSRGEFKTFL